MIEIERDGEVYRLSEIRTEVVKEETGEYVDSIEIASSPFLGAMADANKPDEKLEQDGETYILMDARLEERMIPAHEVPIKEEAIYIEVYLRNR